MTMSDDQLNSENFPKTQDELNKVIQNALAPKLNKIRELEQERDSVASDRDAAKALVAERDQKIAGLEATVADRDRSILVSGVAASKGVPERWLSGDSVEELEASADAWLADAQTAYKPSSDPAPGDDPGEGNPAATRTPTHSAGTGDEKPVRKSYDELKQEAYEKAKTR